MVEGLKYCIKKFGFYSAGSEKSLLLRRGVLEFLFCVVVFGDLEDGIEMELHWRKRDQLGASWKSSGGS